MPAGRHSQNYCDCTTCAETKAKSFALKTNDYQAGRIFHSVRSLYSVPLYVANVLAGSAENLQLVN